MRSGLMAIDPAFGVPGTGLQAAIRPLRATAVRGTGMNCGAAPAAAG